MLDLHCRRLTQEMVRLFKGVAKIIENHMQLQESYINEMPDLSGLDNSNINDSSIVGSNTNSRSVRIAELKKGSIAYSEYKEYCHLIQKLVETSELFLNVNKDLLLRESMKRNKGTWRSSKELKEATTILERLIWFCKHLKL